MKRYMVATAEWEIANDRYETDYRLWKKKAEGVPPTRPVRPVCDRTWTDDATVESLLALLQQVPRGMLLAKDELSAWFEFGRYTEGRGGAVVAKYLEFHGGRSSVSDRKGTPASGGPTCTFVPHASVGICGSIQPGVLRRSLGLENIENGLAPRLLFAMPPGRIKQWTETEVDRGVESAVERVFDRLYSLKHDIDDEGDLCPNFLGLSRPAKALFIKFYNENNVEQFTLKPDLRAVWSKLEGYAARFALVIHLCDGPPARAKGRPALLMRPAWRQGFGSPAGSATRPSGCTRFWRGLTTVASTTGSWSGSRVRAGWSPSAT